MSMLMTEAEVEAVAVPSTRAFLALRRFSENKSTIWS